MPFIHIKSLPLDEPIKVDNIVEGIIEDFSDGTGIDPEHVTVTWEFLQPGHYAVAGKSSTHQKGVSHPVLVDMLSPDFNSAEQIEVMLHTVAASISKRAYIPVDKIFINHRQARSGMVFDAGKVVKW